MIFQTAYLRKQFAAAGCFACPNFVHSVRRCIPHIGDYEVRGLLRVELRVRGCLVDGSALLQDAWQRLVRRLADVDLL